MKTYINELIEKNVNNEIGDMHMENKYLSYIEEKLKDNFDIKYREIKCKQGRVYVIFLDDLSDSNFISQNIIEPLINNRKASTIEAIKNEVIAANYLGDVDSESDAVFHILSGDVILIFDFLQAVIFCEAKKYSKRTITIPLNENVIKGPRAGFTSAIIDNVSLIRQKIKNENLKFESLQLGKKTNTTVVIAYVKDIAPQKLVNNIRNKIESLSIDFILSINYIEEALKAKHTIFDTTGYTEKPDVAVSKLCEGRVVIIVDGSPVVITVPFFFIENLQAPDDYYLNKYFVNISRIQRWIAFFTAMLLPGFYVAITTYHFNLIPTVFVFSLASAREGVPLPTIIEVFLMFAFFQLLREAGIRLPQPTGQTMSIVGALILGEAAVGAGLASQSTIVIVAVSAISTFLIPDLYRGVTLWSSIILIFSSMLGLPGFYLGFFLLISHIASLESCGYSYLYPLGTLKNFEYSDVVTRADLNKISSSIFNEGEE